MTEYLDLLENVLTNGKKKASQKSMPSIAILGQTIRYNLEDGFPLITCRDMSKSWRALTAELLWIMSGSTNAFDLHQHGTHLWDRWAKASEQKLGYQNGELGPTYGHQLRNFSGKTDQLTQVVDMLKRDPNTRRAMISYWNLGDVEEPSGKHIVDVAPCISLLHFEQMEAGKLDLHMVQRSADIPVGVPFDTAEYALLLMLVAKETNLLPGTLVHTLSDAHIYENQIPAVKEMLSRKPYARPSVTILPSSSGSIYDHQVEDFKLENYSAHPRIKMAVED